jgi:pimeloyl-ACP methyl ester carboxylesterase
MAAAGSNQPVVSVLNAIDDRIAGMRSPLFFVLFVTTALPFGSLYPQAALDRGSASREERLMVPSKDGTRIAVRKSGSGRSILFIHGLGVESERAWGRVMPLLNGTHAVYAMDLRGHGQSDDGQNYSISKDGDDIAAVLKMIGRPAAVVAHSYGGLAVIAALDRLEGIDRLVLYEPAVLTESMSPERLKLLEAMESAMASNDLDSAKVAGMRVVGFPERIIEQLRASPNWKSELSLREAERARSRLREHERFRPSSQTLSEYNRPTKMLLGSLTTGWLQQSAKAVCEQLPHCELVILEGQGHIANERAPELFVSKL